METTLNAYQCSDCSFEFVIVGLNCNAKSVMDDPFCPKCGNNDEVHKIDCLEFKMTYKDLQYTVSVNPKLAMMQEKA